MNKRLFSFFLMFVLLFTGIGNVSDVSYAAEPVSVGQEAVAGRERPGGISRSLALEEVVSGKSFGGAATKELDDVGSTGEADKPVSVRQYEAGLLAERGAVKTPIRNQSQPTVKVANLPIGGTISNNDMGIIWSIDEGGHLTISGNGEIYPKGVKVSKLDFDELADYLPWLKENNVITSATVTLSNIQNLGGLFNECTGLTKVDLEGLNTEITTDMSYMFYQCSSLRELDLSKLDTEQVTDMSYMFCGCQGLTSLKVGTFVTEKVTDMQAMFGACKKLRTLDLSSFRTGQVTNMESMFNGCETLQSVDISNFTTPQVKYMSNMFYNCFSLQSLDLSKFTTEKVVWMDDMFEECRVLRSLDLSNFNTSQVEDMRSMFYGCRSLRELKISSFKTEKVRDMGFMFYRCDSLRSLDLSNFNTSQVKDMSYMFTDCRSLQNLALGEFFRTDNVTKMDGMFSNCRSLEELNVSSFNTEKVRSMAAMFEHCSSLKELNVSNFNTSQVTNMYCMFKDCSSLTDLDVSRFDTGIVTNMGLMFDGCQNLQSLHLSNFNTEKVWDMTCMFGSCYSLESLDLSSFRTENVTKMVEMFIGCYSLESLDLSSFRTENVTNMLYMFSGCMGLKELNVSSFNTEKVTNMNCMFYNCAKLTSLDISSFDMSNVSSAALFFEMSSSLTKIYAPFNLSVDVTLPSAMYIMDSGNQRETGQLPKGLKKSVILAAGSVSANIANEIVLSLRGESFKPIVQASFYDVSGNWTLDDISYIELKLDNEDVLSADDWKTFYNKETGILTYPIHIVSEGEHVITVTLVDNDGRQQSKEKTFTVSPLPSSYEETLKTDKGIIDWSIDEEGKLTVKGNGDISKAVTKPWDIPWYLFHDRINSAVVDLRDCSDLSYFFYGCNNLKGVDLKGLDTSVTVSMNSMFELCENLEVLDMGHMNLGNVISAKDFLVSANSLGRVYVPCNLETEIVLPENNHGNGWYDISGGKHTALPKDVNTPFAIIYGKKPEFFTYGVTVRSNKPVFTVSFNDISFDEITNPMDEISELTLEISKQGTLESGEMSETTDWQEVPWPGWKESYDESTRTLTYESQDEYEPGEYESRVTVVMNEKHGKLSIIREAEFTIEKESSDGDDGGSGNDDGNGDDGGSGNDDGNGDDGGSVSGDDGGSGNDDGSGNGSVSGDDGGSGNDDGDGNGSVSGDDGGSGNDDGDGSGSGNDSGNGSGSGNDGPGSGDDDGDDDGTGSGNDGPGTEITKGLWVAGIKAEYEYTGSAIRPDVKVYDGLGQLIEKKEYTVVHKNNKNAYEADDKGKKAPYVEIRMKGNNKGSTRIYYKIMKRDIGDAMLETDRLTAAVKSGKTANITPVLYWQGKKLKANKDYEITAGSTKKVPEGSHTITIEGINNFTGRIENIPVLVHDGTLSGNTVVTMSKLKIKVPEKKLSWKEEGAVFTDFTFTGKPAVPAEGEYTYEYFFHKAAGTGYLVVTGSGRDGNNDGTIFLGTKTLPFKIEGIAMNARNITFNGFEGMEYDHGTAIRPTEMRKEDGTPVATLSSSRGIMAEGEDYTAVYSKNIEKGTATVTFTGNPEKGYTGSVKKTFKIAPAELNPSEYEVQVSGNDVREENGIYHLSFTKQGTTPEITITAPGGKKLLSGKDYTVKYAGNKKVGETATATVKGKGNYGGQLEIKFVPRQKEFTNENGIQVVAKDKTDNKKLNNWKTNIKILDSNGKALSGKEYEIVSYIITDAKDPSRIGSPLQDKSQAQTGDEITVTVKGRGDYAAATNPEATATGTYRILEKGYDISKASFKILPKDFTGEAIEITGQGDFEKAVINPGKKPIALGTDFEVVEGSYVKNVDKGTAKVTLRGIGSYGGTRTVTFKILPRDTTDKIVADWE